MYLYPTLLHKEFENTLFYLYVESKKQNKQNRNQLTDTENKLMVARKGCCWGGQWMK